MPPLVFPSSIATMTQFVLAIIKHQPSPDFPVILHYVLSGAMLLARIVDSVLAFSSVDSFLALSSPETLKPSKSVCGFFLHVIGTMATNVYRTIFAAKVVLQPSITPLNPFVKLMKLFSSFPKTISR
ncbi:hypothetical protein C8J56DRAFT_1101159 [Mycena floridula]|nr:hypothetical protein C8J56DRAFT_1101159 [Mycena floridula]